MQFRFIILSLMSFLSGMPAAAAMMPRLLSKARSTRLVAPRTGILCQQRRTLYAPSLLKGLYSMLPAEKRHLSPVLGASYAQTRYLRNLYVYGNPKDPLVQLVNDPKIGLFHKQEDQFRPSQLKSNPTYSINPSILGHIMGTIETGKLEDKQAQESLVSTWRAEHKKLCDGYAASNQRYSDFLTLLRKGSKANKPHTRSILLAYLNSRASTKQDMLDYLSTANQYAPILTKVSSAHLLADSFSAKDHIVDVDQISLADETLAGAVAFERTVFTLADKQNQKTFYPPQVIQSRAAFKGQL